MKLIITLQHEEGEDKAEGVTLAGSASIRLQYPRQGHIVVDAAQVSIDKADFAYPKSDDFTA